MEISRWVEREIGGRLLRVHDAIYKGTRGRIGHRIPGLPPSLLLHTTGAKTGKPRTASLSYARDGDAYVIVASKGGDPRSPGWYHNLKASPNAG
ncbi:nitroreductase family deazaflavin-dependent oxidoreductase [Mycobacterium sp. SM1]|nr:nitroreductase family deazaflavin-dependent oxidoreductase [Mycobacterium sp. SM1]